MKKAPAIIGAIILLSGAVAACKSEPAATWAPVTGRIMTRWAAEVKPDSVLPEYPRPQMVREGLAQPQRAVGLRHRRPRTPAGPSDVGREDPRAVRRRIGPLRRRQAGRGREGALVPPDVSASRRMARPARSCFISAPWTGRARSGSTAGRSERTAAATTRSPSTSPMPSERRDKQEIVLRVFDPTDEDNSAIARGKQVMQAPRHLVHRRDRASGRRSGWSPCRDAYIDEPEDHAGCRSGQVLTVEVAVAGRRAARRSTCGLAVSLGTKRSSPRRSVRAGARRS